MCLSSNTVFALLNFYFANSIFITGYHFHFLLILLLVSNGLPSGTLPTPSQPLKVSASPTHTHTQEEAYGRKSRTIVDPEITRSIKMCTPHTASQCKTQSYTCALR
ncbi:hypothetical protein GQ43DRAFT_439303 [Delitschia confertaspora ATCC 74209]|uniref:Uncharacterized protein n=1 Tax=Delitschia confertaspora ATCC 74209 TaxID=1513339 RepID=A0A9P4JP90_9PLEO|nr:hypothetical protein GQ43DRAFT_439303 [Delitschia confertaspora ATCC 74209]